MKGRKQKISTRKDNWQGNNRTVSDDYFEVQTFIGITENNLMEVRITTDDLLEQILSPANLNRAYKQVISNKGKGNGDIDGIGTDELLPWLRQHKEEMLALLMKYS